MLLQSAGPMHSGGAPLLSPSVVGPIPVVVLAVVASPSVDSPGMPNVAGSDVVVAPTFVSVELGVVSVELDVVVEVLASETGGGGGRPTHARLEHVTTRTSESMRMDAVSISAISEHRVHPLSGHCPRQSGHMHSVPLMQVIPSGQLSAPMQLK